MRAKMFRSKDFNELKTKKVKTKRLELIDILKKFKNECEKLVENDKELENTRIKELELIKR